MYQLQYHLNTGVVFVNVDTEQEAIDMAAAGTRAAETAWTQHGVGLDEFTVDSTEGPRTFTARQIQFVCWM